MIDVVELFKTAQIAVYCSTEEEMERFLQIVDASIYDNCWDDVVDTCFLCIDPLHHGHYDTLCVTADYALTVGVPVVPFKVFYRLFTTMIKEVRPSLWNLM